MEKTPQRTSELQPVPPQGVPSPGQVPEGLRYLIPAGSNPSLPWMASTGTTLFPLGAKEEQEETPNSTLPQIISKEVHPGNKEDHIGHSENWGEPILFLWTFFRAQAFGNGFVFHQIYAHI
jgi:hypothetical protein